MAKGNRFGMDAVSPADHWNVPVLVLQFSDRFFEFLRAIDEHGARISKHHPKRGVDNVVACCAKVDPPFPLLRCSPLSFLTNAAKSCLVSFSISSQRSISKAALARISFHFGLRNCAFVAVRLADSDLHFFPSLVLGLATPNVAHGRGRISIDHRLHERTWQPSYQPGSARNASGATLVYVC